MTKKVPMLFEGFKTTHSASKQNFIFFINRMITAFSLVFFAEYPGLACIAIIYSIGSKVMFTVHVRPYKMKKMNRIEILNDVSSILMIYF